ncbi:YhcN/YlaJ family sporulation lipoprotein [Aquibacillus sediminis]|uniref:YhcN/YlaJ family sporulation lipoprotein n=1 Tax=Aquibacillus sediminis TaxID=2574734 RepID=UPI0011099B9B|nr:YhcN/YlaJ family sporulation lipoprotein [Aquibacillus sediminis]
MGRKLTITVITLMISLMLYGCNQEEENSLPEQGNQDSPIQVKNSDPVEQNEDLSNQEIAQHLANLATDVPTVNNAQAVVAGPYAVVGIDVDKELDRSRVSTIKYSVAEALHHDPYGKTAVVVADADGTERIQKMADKIRQGHPVEGFVDEVAAIVGRYMPEFPINEDQPNTTDQNKEVVPEDEKEQLEEIQDNQSNNHKDKN